MWHCKWCWSYLGAEMRAALWFDDVHCSPAADAAPAKQADDEFLMFDEDISVKLPRNITSLLHGVKGRRIIPGLHIIVATFSHSHNSRPTGHCDYVHRRYGTGYRYCTHSYGTGHRYGMAFWPAFVCLCVSRITQEVMIRFCWNLGIGRLWTRKELVKFWKVRVRVITCATHCIMALWWICWCVVIAALWNRAGHYIFALWFLFLFLLSFFLFLA